MADPSNGAESRRVDIVRLAALAEAATPGPWREMRLLPPPTVAIERPYRGGAATPIAKVWSPEDAALIAFLDPSTVLALVARIPPISHGACTPDEPYVISDERLEEIRALIDWKHPGWQTIPWADVTVYQLAGAIEDLLTERGDRAR
jgi:hypothetical protein